MPFTAIQQQKIISALDSKVTLACASCGQSRRQLIPDLLPIHLQGDSIKGLEAFRLGPITLPSIAVVCGNCGRTEIYNVHALGVAADLGIPPPGSPVAT